MERPSSPLYGAIAPLVGALITGMCVLNGRFAALAGNLVATLVIHASGLVAVSVLLLFTREAAKPGRLPVYYYLGGMVGVGTVFSANYAFGALGASLAVALALLGQTLFSLVLDAVGLLGRTRFPPSVRHIPGIALALVGVVVIAGSWRADLPGVVLGLLTGILPGLSILLNSELGRRKGVFRSTRFNFLVGVATTLAIAVVLRPPAAEALHAMARAGLLLTLGGGLIGVVVVTALNLIFPRMPAFSATLLLFSGQAFTGVVVDFFADGSFDPGKLAGSLVLLAGLAINSLMSRRS
jgi:transporter family-2 protein